MANCYPLETHAQLQCTGIVALLKCMHYQPTKSTYALHRISERDAEGVHSAKDGGHRLNCVAVDTRLVLFIVFLCEASLVDNPAN